MVLLVVVLIRSVYPPPLLYLSSYFIHKFISFMKKSFLLVIGGVYPPPPLLVFIYVCLLPLGKPQKKSSFTNGQALSLMAIGTFFKKFFFSLKIAENGF